MHSEIHVLFAFDLKRQAILLVSGDKSENWKSWYPENISIAETRFEEHQTRKKTRSAKRQQRQQRQHRRKRMSLKNWENKVLSKPGAKKRVQASLKKLELAVWLVSLREKAGLSQRDLAAKLKISQPRVASLERAQNVTLEVLLNYVHACGGSLKMTASLPGKKASSWTDNA